MILTLVDNDIYRLRVRKDNQSVEPTKRDFLRMERAHDPQSKRQQPNYTNTNEAVRYRRYSPVDLSEDSPEVLTCWPLWGQPWGTHLFTSLRTALRYSPVDLSEDRGTHLLTSLRTGLRYLPVDLSEDSPEVLTCWPLRGQPWGTHLLTSLRTGLRYSPVDLLRTALRYSPVDLLRTALRYSPVDLSEDSPEVLISWPLWGQAWGTHLLTSLRTALRYSPVHLSEDSPEVLHLLTAPWGTHLLTSLRRALRHSSLDLRTALRYSPVDLSEDSPEVLEVAS